VLVLYDEGCRFCTTMAEALAARGVRVAAIGSPVGETWLRDLDREARYAAFHAVDAVGRRRSGGAAVPLVLDALPGGAPLATLARGAPCLTDLGYALVARNRSALSRVVRRASRARAG
jgi:predicted DCC family thiol-disulfide oxidoreductase YuxK